jgi:phage tail sheath protein FI
MPTYLTPGVYVEEVASASKPIEGVGTAVAAFVGLAPAGPINTPMRIANWTQFANTYSDQTIDDPTPFMDGAYLAHSVYGFFQNGGSLCWVVRVGNEADAPPARAALPAAQDKGVEAARAVALDAANGPVKVSISEEPAQAAEGKEAGDPTYRLVVDAGSEHEEYTGLTLKKGRANIATKVNAGSKLIKIEETDASLPDTRLATGSYTLTSPSAAKQDVDATHFSGDVAKRTGMGGLAAIDEVTMVAMPDAMNLNGDGTQLRDVQTKMIDHCESMGDRMAILDAPRGLTPAEVLEWRMDTAGYDSKMAALYWPWIEVMDPLSKLPIMVPPSGHLAGLWARVDGERGVHKAPANEVVRGTIGLGFQITQSEQGELNRNGVNCIRAFSGRGIRVWGARTLSSDPEWRYINVRRLFNYVSESISEGTQWSVFEPNDSLLWMRLRAAASNFLKNTWGQGALFGATEAEAFYVKCDAETNPPEVVEAGQVICEIGIAPVKPAEFVIFRLSQFTGGAESQVEE